MSPTKALSNQRGGQFNNHADANETAARAVSRALLTFSEEPTPATLAGRAFGAGADTPLDELVKASREVLGE